MTRLLAISGSLRAVSTNSALLHAAALLAPKDVIVERYASLAALPHFNPDDDVDPLSPVVVALRQSVAQADGLLISSPEYARGVPGSLKNALDWLVGSDVFPGKPVALFHASDRGVAAQASLRLTLETMSARIVDEASITLPLLGKQTDAEAIAADQAHAATIRGALETFVRAIG